MFIALEQHPDYPVIICANRDEFHQRPTQSMHWWPKQNILAGKDLQAGGSWLGLNSDGYFAALTNFRRPESFDKNKRSRGDIVVQALKQSPLETEQYLSAKSHQYNDFNLIFGALNNLQTFDSVKQKFAKLTPGFHSVCNGALDDIWPKMALGLKNIEGLITDNNVAVDALFSLMRNQKTADEHNLPTTGISSALEALLSSIFIISPDYGTRSSVIILQAKNGDVNVYENNYNTKGEAVNDNQSHFTLAQTKFN